MKESQTEVISMEIEELKAMLIVTVEQIARFRKAALLELNRLKAENIVYKNAILRAAKKPNACRYSEKPLADELFALLEEIT